MTAARAVPWQDLAAGARLLLALPRAHRHPFDLAEAHAILRRRFETREAGFLGLVRRAVYEYTTRARSTPRARLAGIVDSERGPALRPGVAGGSAYV